MARPKKSEDEKLVPAKVALRPDVFDALDKEARREGVGLSIVIRRYVERSFGNPKPKAENSAVV